MQILGKVADHIDLLLQVIQILFLAHNPIVISSNYIDSERSQIILVPNILVKILCRVTSFILLHTIWIVSHAVVIIVVAIILDLVLLHLSLWLVSSLLLCGRDAQISFIFLVSKI